MKEEYTHLSLQRVETNILYEHWTGKVMKFTVIAFFTLVTILAVKHFDYLTEYRSLVEEVGSSLSVLIAVFILANSILFRRIGMVEIKEGIIQYEEKGVVIKIDLKTVEKIRISIVQRKIYEFQIDNTSISLKLTNSELKNLKDLLSQFPITLTQGWLRDALNRIFK